MYTCTFMQCYLLQGYSWHVLLTGALQQSQKQYWPPSLTPDMMLQETDSSLREAFSSADRQDPAEDWLVHKQSDPEEPDEAPSLQQPLLGGR